ncbi:phosphotransferase [Pseudidiomarina sp. PP-1MA]|uniref:Phosphotransferase n=1 Tax=Pseudidiomarina sp. PP-1MA TaxID=3237706 RepID=A0AB39X5A0_9GAMM
MQQQWLTNLPIHGVLDTQPLLKGVANDVYKIITTEQSYVLKHFRYDHPYGLNRDQEVALQQQLAEQQLAPAVLYYDTIQGLLLQPFISGDDLAHSTLAMSTKIQRLAEVSARIHRVQVDVPVWSLRSRLQIYCDALARYDEERARQFRKRIGQQRKLIDCFGMNPVFCHNDLAFHHVFTQPHLQVIDWEYAGMGERYFDLANSMLANDFDNTQQRAFIHSYEGVAGIHIHSQQLADWLQLAETVSQLWYELHHNLQGHT